VRPRPLAAYYFRPDDAARRRFLDRSDSGGVTINDVIVHFAVAGMPFGGVGESGMGAYHGRAGFETFSHGRGVLRSPDRFAATSLLAAPYTAARRIGPRGRPAVHASGGAATSDPSPAMSCPTRETSCPAGRKRG
jgi:hypothetical protein